MKNKKIAFLIPCYNESKTIRKVVEDCKMAIPEATIMFTTIILQMEQMKSLEVLELKYTMSINKEKAMLSEGCLEKLTQIAILC